MLVVPSIKRFLKSESTHLLALFPAPSYVWEMDFQWVGHLEKWYARHARPLPWRKTLDPYFIWLSEVMLQQTQVATVIPYYEKFLTLFPTLKALAESDEASVLAAWSGLGYYSRAKNLRKGAQYLVEHWNAKFPREREALLKVPGIGPYTAGAILSIAYDLPIPLVDGNVQRVFARYFGIEKEIQLPEVQKRFWHEAASSVEKAKSPRFFNQALMELGATVCVKGAPRCLICPLNKTCVALAKGLETTLPYKKAPREKKDLWWAALVFETKGKILLQKNPQGTWWSELWDFPRVELKERAELDRPPKRYLKKGLAPSPLHLRLQKHTVTHHRLHVAPFLMRVEAKKDVELPAGQWFDVGTVTKLPISSLVRKVLVELPVLK